jgi:hypothetical protein
MHDSGGDLKSTLAPSRSTSRSASFISSFTSFAFFVSFISFVPFVPLPFGFG